MTALKTVRPLAVAAALALGVAPVLANPHPWWWFFGADGGADTIRLVDDWSFDSGTWRANTLIIGRDILGHDGSPSPVPGSLLQRGGSFTVGAVFIAAGAEGRYTLAGGNLSAGTVDVGGGDYGVFTQQAGTLSFANLTIGSTTCCRGISGSLVDLQGGVRILTQTTVGTYSTLRLSGGATSGTQLVVDLGKLEMHGGTLSMSQGIALQSRAVRGGVVRPDMAFTGGAITGGPVRNEGVIAWGGGSFITTLQNVNGAEVEATGSTLFASRLVNDGGVRLARGVQLDLGAGSSSNGATGVVDFDGGAVVRLQGELVNLGTLRGALAFTGPGILTNAGSLVAAEGSAWRFDMERLVNADGATLSVRGARIGGSALIDNRSGGVVTMGGQTRIDSALRNAGRVDVREGRATVAGGIVNLGTLAISHAQARLDGGDARNEGLLTGHGRIDSALTNSGTVRAEGGTLWLDQVPTLSGNGRLQAVNGATLVLGRGLPLLEREMRLDGGTIDVRGSTLNTGRIEGTGTLITTGLVHRGQMIWLGDGQVRGSASVEARVDVASGATLTWSDAVTLTASARLAPAIGGRMHFAAPVSWLPGAQGTGAGELSFGGLVAFDGVGDVARVHAGSLRLLDTAVLRLDLTGAGAHDRLAVGGALALGGTVQVRVGQGFAGAAGDGFQLLAWSGPVSGSFMGFDTGGVEPGLGLVWDWSTLAVDGMLRVAAVPEPGSLPLFAVGGLWLWWRQSGRARAGQRRATQQA